MHFSRYINPRMTGVVVKEAVKCGKDNCRCSKGEMHKWYYYLYYRTFENDKWKLKKEYISQSKAKYLKRKIKALKDNDMQMKSRLSANMTLLNDAVAFTRGNLSGKELLKNIYEIA